MIQPNDGQDSLKLSPISRFLRTSGWIAACVGMILMLPQISVAQRVAPSRTAKMPTLNQPTQIAPRFQDDAEVSTALPTVGPSAETNPNPSRTWANDEARLIDVLARESEKLASREGTGSSIQLVILLGALSLAPAILLMTTSYIRIIVVLTLLRQALGAQQLPPNQVLTALSIFLTLLVMTPVWKEVKTEAIDPYSKTESKIAWDDAWQRGIVPVKRFMGRQIEIAKNGQSIAMFYKYLPEDGDYRPPTRIEDVPITVLLPAFIVSELKVAFLIGFQIFLPFLVLDFVVSTITVSMGMLMLPPTMVSFPLKLILFVMVDGWSMVVGMLLQSFGPFT